MRRLRHLIQSLLQDGFDAVGGGRPHLQSSEAGGVQAIFAMAAGEAEQTQAGSVTLLGVGLTFQLPTLHIPGRGTTG